MAGDKQIVATEIGDVSICINGVQITFQDLLFSPELNMNFASVSRVVDKGLSVVFNSKAAEIKRKDGSVVLLAVKEHNLFGAESKRTFLCAANSADDLWYNRFVHVNFRSLS